MKAICSRESREGVHRQDWDSGEGGLNFPTKLLWKGSAVGFINSSLIFNFTLSSTVYVPTASPNI